MTPIISISDLNKVYRLYDHRIDRLKESLHPLRKRYSKDFHALRDITFAVMPGQTVGIVGRNGSGKSTLLKIIADVLTPSSGQVDIQGKVSALLELGTGFNPDFTGVENIYFFGTISGYTQQEIADRLDSIIAFAELGDFIHQPVKVYSSGMYVRLAFAVAVNIDPEILIVDEALSVGDAFFQVKSMSRMRRFKEDGKTVLFVSHDVNAVKSLCDHVILLDEGRIIEQGDPSTVIDLYSNLIAQDVHQGEAAMNINQKLSALPLREGGSGAPGPDATSHDGFTTGETELLSFSVCNQAGEEVSLVTSENQVEVRFELRANKALDQPHFSVMVRNRFGFPVFATSTYFMGLQPDPMRAGQVVQGTFSFRLNLAAENYSLSFSANNRGYDKTLFEEYLILVHDLAVVQVLQNNDAILYHGVFNMHPEFASTVKGTEEA